MATNSSSRKRKGVLKDESEEMPKKPRSRIDTSGREDSESSKSDAISDVSISNESSPLYMTPGNSRAGSSHIGFPPDDSEDEEDNQNVDYFEDEPLPHLDTDKDSFGLLNINDTVSTFLLVV